MAKLRVSPGNLPYRASVSARWMYEFGALALFGVAGKGSRFTLSASGRRRAGARRQLRQRL